MKNLFLIALTFLTLHSFAQEIEVSVDDKVVKKTSVEEIKKLAMNDRTMTRRHQGEDAYSTVEAGWSASKWNRKMQTTPLAFFTRSTVDLSIETDDTED